MLKYINKNYKFILILIILATLLLRILPFESRSWAMDADSQIVKEALQIGQGIAQGDWQFLKEPILFPFIGPYIYLFFYGIFFVFGKLLYLFNNADEFISYIFFNIQDFYWWGRILIGIFGTMLVPLVFFATRRIMQKIDEKKAIIFSFFAAVLTALNLILVIFSEQPRPHVLVAFFIFLTFYFYLRFLDHKKIRDYFLLSLSCGLAIGVLQNGIFAVIFFILASYYLFKDNTYFAWLKFIMAGIIILGIFAISYPYAILNFSSVSEVEQGKFESVNGFDFTLSSGSQTFSGLNGKGFNVFVKGLFFYHPTLSFVFILFLLIFIFLKFNLFAFLKNNLFCHPNDFSCHPDESRDPVSGSRVTRPNDWRRLVGREHGMTNAGAFVGLGLFIISYSLILIIYDGARIRFMAPLTPFLSIIGAIFLYYITQTKIVFKKIILSIIIIILLLFEFVQALRFIYLISQPYTRDESVEWIQNNISQDKLILVQSRGPILLPDKKSLELQVNISPESLTTKDIFLSGLSDDKYPIKNNFILRLGLVGNKFQSKEPLEKLLLELKPNYFVLFYTTPKPEDFISDFIEFELAKKYGQTVKKFLPFKNINKQQRMMFTWAFENPIIDLWNFKKLGPVIDIYELKW